MRYRPDRVGDGQLTGAAWAALDFFSLLRSSTTRLSSCVVACALTLRALLGAEGVECNGALSMKR